LVVFDRAVLPLSHDTRWSICPASSTAPATRFEPCWRKLNCGQHALLVWSTWERETFAELAARFTVSTNTSWRYVT